MVRFHPILTRVAKCLHNPVPCCKRQSSAAYLGSPPGGSINISPGYKHILYVADNKGDLVDA